MTNFRKEAWMRAAFAHFRTLAGLSTLLLMAAATLASARADCFRGTLPVTGVMRSGVVCEPSAGSGPMPVLLAYHGHGGSGLSLAQSTHFHLAWPEALVVYPDGLTGTATPNDPQGLETGWQLNPGDSGDRDVAFAEAIYFALAGHYNIDTRRVYVAGHSNGARFASVLWNMRGNHIAAFAFSAAQGDTLIQGAVPRSAFMGMGTNDDVVPFALQKPSILYAETLLGIPLGTIDPGKLGLQSASNLSLELETYIHDGGHIWPDGQTAMIVDFFRRH